MAYMKAGWQTVRTSNTKVEILPSHDVIDHDKGIICPCNPTVSSSLEGGVLYWEIIHNSFDEFLDESDTSPYIGI